MNQATNKIKAIFLASSILLSANTSLANNAEDRHFYIGSELGISEPIVKSFEEMMDGEKAKMRLTQSKMYGGRVGYSFYPGMMIELSGTHQPKFRLAYKLPVKNPATGLEITGKTKIATNVFTLNMIFEMEKQFAGIKPYVIVGAGIAKVMISSTNSEIQGLGSIFEIKKNTINCLATQVGVGLVRDLGANFSVDLGAKMQLIKDIKLKYDAADTSYVLKSRTPIKKTIAVGEFTLGFTFKLPV